VDRIKRLSNEVLNEYSERFGTDFSTNKQTLNEITVIRSKGLKNEIAGYITKMLQRQAKFEERKQMIIENEKKSQERKKSRSKKQETEVTEEVETEVESTEEVEVDSEPEPVVSEEKTTAEEIVDESKSE
jgi:small subunit ribosomal protein S17e|tara:strand:- start:1226 stop:1615 length:390 start_codon:yes stop_codon:yes gene_type:complete